MPSQNSSKQPRVIPEIEQDNRERASRIRSFAPELASVLEEKTEVPNIGLDALGLIDDVCIAIRRCLSKEVAKAAEQNREAIGSEKYVPAAYRIFQKYMAEHYAASKLAETMFSQNPPETSAGGTYPESTWVEKPDSPLGRPADHPPGHPDSY